MTVNGAQTLTAKRTTKSGRSLYSGPFHSDCCTSSSTSDEPTQWQILQKFRLSLAEALLRFEPKTSLRTSGTDPTGCTYRETSTFESTPIQTHHRREVHDPCSCRTRIRVVNSGQSDVFLSRELNGSLAVVTLPSQLKWRSGFRVSGHWLLSIMRLDFSRPPLTGLSFEGRLTT